MIVFGFEHVVVFVCNLPAPAASLGHFRDVGSVQVMVGDKAVVIELFARVRMHHGDLAPVHREGILAASQGNIVEGAHHHDFRETAMETAVFHLFDGVIGLPKGQALVQFGMRVRLAHKDEGAPLVSGQRTQGLVAVEVIAQ
jgi:hypothetical protein